jgi:hypothetical protein
MTIDQEGHVLWAYLRIANAKSKRHIPPLGVPPCRLDRAHEGFEAPKFGAEARSQAREQQVCTAPSVQSANLIGAASLAPCKSQLQGARTKWLVSSTLAPLSVRYLRVGMAARMRVSSVMFWLLSRGTFRSALTYSSKALGLVSKTAVLQTCARTRVWYIEVIGDEALLHYTLGNFSDPDIVGSDKYLTACSDS